MKYLLFLALAFPFSTLFAQQLLWTTSEKSGEKYIPIKTVSDKVLDFHEHYKYYYDGSGFSKNSFIKSFESSSSYKKISDESVWEELKEIVKTINTPTVVAFKDNLGNGSVVFVIFISKENVDMLTFSNNLEENAILTNSYKKEEFRKWFNSFLK
ncbi:hypothetical protein SAMN05443634_106174 [Chishuiella changwenlii]|uniref:Uncharacterized protein n=1 Tax=Chishuiella changwenlii TaxID=1434701 RepID=A0A1M6YB85_9FLAO|nr:hypothetical protein [Chishuiella changwenlii]GGE97844.1 hypothetical protein GCM10010984_14240 [Chishuiella changwenlii]SHL15508.1 hypothetical protein SAMN05443634_106174 [Chishuiella changwenlii]